MQIIEPYARMLSPLMHGSYGLDDEFTPIEFDKGSGIEMLRRIEYFARVSHRSEEAMTESSYDKLLRAVVLSHGDWSVTEHEKVTVEMVVDRGITHEIVRHRIGSYTQESTRFVNYQKKGGEAKFIVPLGIYKDDIVWNKAMAEAEYAYMTMLSCGIKPQIARGVLPNSLAAKIIITYNLRSWRHFFLMRTSAETHPQLKEVSVPLLQKFQDTIPILFEDIIPGKRQVDNMKLAR